jgi:hypothetical protein
MGGFFMKKLGKSFGIFVLVTVIGFIITACSNGSGGGKSSGNNQGSNNNNNNASDITGTWTGVDNEGDDISAVITSSGWKLYYDGSEIDYGTYTRNGDVASLYSNFYDQVTGTATLINNNTIKVIIIYPVTGTYNLTRI